MAPNRKLIFLILVCILSLPLPFAARIFRASDRKKQDSSSKGRGYAYGDWIPLLASKVFGADERCYAHWYFKLPFCPPGEIVPKSRPLNEILAGDCLTNTQYDLKFGVTKPEGFLCEKYMIEDDLEMFKKAIANKYEYQMYFDKIWFGGKVGEFIEETGLGKKFYLFNHIEFNIDFMENQVMGISVVQNLDSSVDITNVTETLVEFSYSVFWNEVKSMNNLSYLISGNKGAPVKGFWVLEENRRMFWTSLWLWSIMGFWWIISPILVASPYLYWYFLRSRQRHGSHRRLNDRACFCPMFSSLLGATLGVGTQHLVIILLLFASAYDGVYPCDHKRISVDIVLAYWTTSALSAFMARAFHEKFSSIGTKECVFQTGALYFFPAFIAVLIGKVFGISTPLVDHAIYYISVAGIGSAMCTYLCCIAIRNFFGMEHNNTATCPTRILQLICNRSHSSLWYMKTPAQMILVGLGIFLPISPLMDDIYASLWGFKVCGSFVTLLTAFVIVILATLVSGVMLTSIQLLKHDYSWWWRSVLRGGSPALYIFGYGIYFISKIKTESDRELVFPLVYNCCICYSLFLVLGTVGFGASFFAFKYYTAGFTKKRS